MRSRVRRGKGRDREREREKRKRKREPHPSWRPRARAPRRRAPSPPFASRASPRTCSASRRRSRTTRRSPSRPPASRAPRAQPWRTARRATPPRRRRRRRRRSLERFSPAARASRSCVAPPRALPRSPSSPLPRALSCARSSPRRSRLPPPSSRAPPRAPRVGAPPSPRVDAPSPPPQPPLPLASGVFFSRVIVAFARSHAAPASRIPVSRRLARSRSASGPGAPAPYGQPRIGRHDDGPGAPSAASAASESRHRVAAFSASVVTLDQCASESARSVSHSRAARSRFAYRLWPFVCVAERSKAAAAACASALHFADAEKSASATRHGRPQTTPLSEDETSTDAPVMTRTILDTRPPPAAAARPAAAAGPPGGPRDAGQPPRGPPPPRRRATPRARPPSATRTARSSLGARARARRDLTLRARAFPRALTSPRSASWPFASRSTLERMGPFRVHRFFEYSRGARSGRRPRPTRSSSRAPSCAPSARSLMTQRARSPERRFTAAASVLDVYTWQYFIRAASSDAAAVAPRRRGSPTPRPSVATLRS